jgi:hypothetical protein
MTRSREDAPFEKKQARISISLSERDELKLRRAADESGIPAAVLGRIALMQFIAKVSRDGGMDDYLSSSNFSPLGDD